ncbi:MAG TPA: dihydrofolate reductase family protein [Flavitalea sp.]|nr:dihydrofolate reductase family protein [Flavitalea sp.]
MKISLYMAISANGLISNARNAPDWLSNEYAEGMMGIVQKKQAVIMGKTTYKILAPDYLPLKTTGTTVVFTNDVSATPPNPTVVFTNKTPEEIVLMLEEREHKQAVIIGGTTTINQFMKADLVDDIYLIVEPVLFGSGLDLFNEPGVEHKLSLIEVMKLNNNTVQLHYAVKP